MKLATLRSRFENVSVHGCVVAELSFPPYSSDADKVGLGITAIRLI